MLRENSAGVVGYYNVPNKLTESGAGGNGTPNTPGTTTNSEGYSYVDDVPTVPLHGRHSSAHHKSSSSHSSSHREHSQQNRTRRTQRRVTHNEKRYHSGQSLSDDDGFFLLYSEQNSCKYGVILMCVCVCVYYAIRKNYCFSISFRWRFSNIVWSFVWFCIRFLCPYTVYALWSVLQNFDVSRFLNYAIMFFFYFACNLANFIGNRCCSFVKNISFLLYCCTCFYTLTKTYILS